jgi:1,4-dihydroxy-2-naphthoyl-CoA hydrolase
LLGCLFAPTLFLSYAEHMKIWKTKLDLIDVNQRGIDTMSEHLGIDFIEVGDDYLVARMPIDNRTKQPIGIMHGGASCVLAETVGSTAANFCVDINTHYCVGLDINTNHIRSVREGVVIGTAKPFHLGKTTQVWSIEICDEAGRLVSVNRLTMAILTRTP